MNEKLQKIKEYYLKDVDSETYEENQTEILELEKLLQDTEMLKSWQEHEITKRVKEFAKKEYLDISRTLAMKRDLTEADRQKLFAERDASEWILRLSCDDVNTDLLYLNTKLDSILSKL